MRQEKIDEAIKILQLASKMSELYYQEPLIITYSGGKDSDALVRLAELSGIRFEVLNSHTTVDAPQTVHHIRETFERLRAKGIKCTIHYPIDKDGNFVSMWRLIVEKCAPPTRIVRYCCKELKESSTPNRIIVTGVRKDESTKRMRRSAFETRVSRMENKVTNNLDRMEEVFEASEQSRTEQSKQPNDYDVWDCKFIETAKKKKDTICNPIINWTRSDVWDFIHEQEIPYNPLYDMGYERVGCIGCPMGRCKGMSREFNDFPKYKELYIRAFDRMVVERKRKGMPNKLDWQNGEDVMRWWMNDPNNIKGQMNIDDMEW